MLTSLGGGVGELDLTVADVRTAAAVASTADGGKSTDGGNLDVAAVVEAVSHRLEAQEDGALRTQDRLYRAQFGSSGFSMTLRANSASEPELDVLADPPLPHQRVLDELLRGDPQSRHRPIPFDDAATFAVSVSSVHVGDDEKLLRPAPWSADRNVAERGIAPGFTERVTAKDGHLEWDVVLAERVSGDLSIKATVSTGQNALPSRIGAASSQAWQWSVAPERGVRMGEIGVIDASGREIYRALPSFTGDQVNLRVPARVLEGAKYPVTVDPVISPEYPVSSPVYGFHGEFSSVASDQPIPGSLSIGASPHPNPRTHLVVWWDYRSARAELWATRVSEDGVLLDPSGIRITNVYGSESDVEFHDDVFLVTWKAWDFALAGYVIKAARVNIDGELEGGPVSLSPAGDAYSSPRVAWNGGQFLVVWRDDSLRHIYGRRIGSNGIVQGTAPVQISELTGEHQTPSIASDGSNALIAWSSTVRMAGEPQTVTRDDVAAAWVPGSNDAIVPIRASVSAGKGKQFNPDVAWNGSHFLIVWQDSRRYDNEYTYDIYGARVGTGGAVLDPSGIRVSTVEGENSSDPAVASDGNNFLVVWTAGWLPNSVIKGARVDELGIVLDAQGLQIAPDSPQAAPSVSWASGNYLVTWTEFGYESWSEHASALHGAFVDDATGIPGDSPFVIVRTANPQHSPAVAWNGQHFLVVWEDWRAGQPDIYAVRTSPAGLPLGGDAGIPISNTAEWERKPTVAARGTQFLVAWMDDRRWWWERDPSDIYAARVSGAGQVLDTRGIAVTTADDWQYEPVVAAAGDGFLIAWTDERWWADTGASDIYAARFTDADGVIEDDGIPVTRANDWQYEPAVAADGDGFLIAWTDDRWWAETGSSDIYAARVSGAGSVLGGAEGIAVSRAANWQYEPAVAWGWNRFVVTWTDWRSGTSSDVYGTTLNESGVLQNAGGKPISTAIGGQDNSTLGATRNGFLVAWTDRRSGTSRDVFASRLSPDATALDPSGFSVSASPANEDHPTLINGSAGLAAVSYRSRPVAGYESQRVFVRFISGLGRSLVDFDGNGSTDTAVFRPSTGQWFSTTGFGYAQFGTPPNDIPVPADYDGDGDAEIAIYRPSTGQWFSTGGGFGYTQFGTSGDVPVPADYDGDGDAEVAVYRPSTGQWFTTGGGFGYTQFGTSGDVPVPADYDGDGDAEIAVYRPSTGQWFSTGGGFGYTQFGIAGDVPVPADYDGDGDAEIAVYRPTTGQWFSTGGGFGYTQFGTPPHDVPIPGDYDGDGDAEVAVYRRPTGQWFTTGGGFGYAQFGSPGDIPLPMPAATRLAFFP